MLITTGTVRDGVIHVDSEDFRERAKVTVLARDGNEAFAPDAIQEAKLLAALAEAELGDVFGAEELLDQLPGG